MLRGLSNSEEFEHTVSDGTYLSYACASLAMVMSVPKVATVGSMPRCCMCSYSCRDRTTASYMCSPRSVYEVRLAHVSQINALFQAGTSHSCLADVVMGHRVLFTTASVSNSIACY